MKKVIIGISTLLISIITILIIVKLNDRDQLLLIKEDSPVFSAWECGLSCETEQNSVFVAPAGETINILSTKYGKDFMAIKIKYQEKEGWIIFDGRKQDYVRKNST